MQLVSGREYKGDGKWVRFQVILNGGTVALSCRNPSAAASSSVESMTEGFTDVHTPLLGFYSVVLTGTAEVHT